MKKIVLAAAVLISLLGFTACEQSPTEVTVQAPSQASEFKEVKWIGYPNRYYSSSSNYYHNIIDGLKLSGVDSVKAMLQSSSIYNFGTADILTCDYIKIRINTAEPSSSISKYGDVTVVFKPKNSNAECVRFYDYGMSAGSNSTYLQWEYK